MIEIKNISKSFNKIQVLYDVSATFERGKTTLIIGQSGSGKTVLLKSIVGLHTIDKGSIFYDGVPFNNQTFKSQQEIRKQMGMLFQGSALFDSMDVEKNVKFPLDMYTELSEEEKKDKVITALERVNLVNINHLFPSELSGGMKKRVAIARAIVMKPKYLFCDEPTSGLDPKTATIIDELIYEITVEYNTTTIINTHDFDSVMQIGEKVCFIYQGNKWWEGSKGQLLDSNNDELNDFVFSSVLAQQARGFKIMKRAHTDFEHYSKRK